MLVKLGEWLDERFIGGRSGMQFLRKVPKVNWFYTLGSATFVAVLRE
jgi:hypothetical protein